MPFMPHNHHCILVISFVLSYHVMDKYLAKISQDVKESPTQNRQMSEMEGLTQVAVSTMLLVLKGSLALK